MSLVHIFGNGFDRNANLLTSYGHFYDYYLKDSPDEPFESDVILKLKKAMQEETLGEEKVDTWADLEIALGQYTAEVDTAEDFIEILEDVNEKLSTYLSNVEKKIKDISLDVEALDYFKSCLLNPEQFAPHNWSRNVDTKQTLENISIVTFNYTKTIELLLPDADLDVMHVHGTLESNSELILGVDNVNQIKNKEFHNNIQVTNRFLKPKTSVLKDDESPTQVVDECKRAIQNASLISIFGCSLGKTDRTWWHLIHERVRTGGAYVIIFHKPDKRIILRTGADREDERTRFKEKFLAEVTNRSNLYGRNIRVVLCRPNRRHMFDVFPEDT